MILYSARMFSFSLPVTNSLSLSSFCQSILYFDLYLLFHISLSLLYFVSLDSSAIVQTQLFFIGSFYPSLPSFSILFFPSQKVQHLDIFFFLTSSQHYRFFAQLFTKKKKKKRSNKCKKKRKEKLSLTFSRK